MHRFGMVVDDKGLVFLLVGIKRTSTIGVLGQCPCEYRQVSAYTVSSDTLFVPDTRLSRITGYSTKSGSCLSEAVSPDLSPFTGIPRVGNWFHLLRTGYTTVTPPGESLLYRFKSGASPEPLGLTKADLGADLLMMPMQAGNQFTHVKGREGSLYFLLLLTHRVSVNDISGRDMSFIELEFESPDIPPTCRKRTSKRCRDHRPAGIGNGPVSSGRSCGSPVPLLQGVDHGDAFV